MKQLLNKHAIFCWWTKLEEICPSLSKERTVMFIGIDVYHAPIKLVGEKNIYKRRRSIGAFVSVIFSQESDGQFTTTCDVVDVMGGKELIGRADSGSGPSDSESVVSDEGEGAKLLNESPLVTKNDSLHLFVKKTCQEKRINPSTIIVYRDGVGDGQMDMVKDTEVKQVQQACPQAKLIYATVKKRIHSRFFTQCGGSHYENPPPGTIITDLQHLKYAGFFLIPTTTKISTVKPVHYSFVHNFGHVPMEEFQRLTFALCHLYPNWTDAIKLPLPTQLAHKLAWQMGETSINSPSVHANFFNSCFYL